MALQQRVADARHERLAGQELDHLLGVAHVALHAQRQRLDALQDQPGGVRAHAGAEVAQAFAPRAQQEGADGGFLGEHHVVEAVVGLAQLGEFAAAERVPVEAAAVHHHAADHRAVAAQELGGRVVDQVGAVLERLHQPGRGEGRVHQQRHAGLVGDRAHRGNVQHVQARVAHGLAEEAAWCSGRIAARQPSMSPGLTKVVVDAEAAQRVVQQVLRAAVQRGAGHDVRAGAHQRGNAQVQRGLAAGRRRWRRCRLPAPPCAARAPRWSGC